MREKRQPEQDHRHNRHNQCGQIVTLHEGREPPGRGSLVVSADIQFCVSNIYILFRVPAERIGQSNGIQVFLSCFCPGFLIRTGFVEGIQIVAHHCFKLSADTGAQSSELEIILFRVPAGINIQVNEQLIIQQDVLGTL